MYKCFIGDKNGWNNCELKIISVFFSLTLVNEFSLVVNLAIGTALFCWLFQSTSKNFIYNVFTPKVSSVFFLG